MRSAVEAVVAAVLALVFAALFDLAPVMAKAMVRRAAYWWDSDLDSAEELAEEWEALVEARPVGVMKLVTALGFLAQGALRLGGRSAGQRARQVLSLRREITSAGDVLIWLSGASPGIARQAPMDRHKFASLGGIVASSTAMAGGSIYIALHTIFKIPAVAAAPSAAMSTLIMMGSDRWWLASLRRCRGLARVLRIALPRLLLGFLLGVITAVPIVLQVFRTGIAPEVSAIQATRSAAYLANVRSDPLVARITATRNEIKTLKAELSAIKPGTDQAVARLGGTELATARTELRRETGQQATLTARGLRAINNDKTFPEDLQALSDLTSGNSSIKMACWLLYALCTLTACLPLAMKLLLLLGPESSYEILEDLPQHPQ